MSGERNDVTIHVKAQDDGTAKVFKKVKEDAKRGGAAAGDEFSGSFSGQLMANKAEMGKAGESLGKDLTKGAEKAAKAAKPLVLPATAENPIDAAWRAKVEASLKATAKDALQIPVTPKNEGFQRELSRLLDQASHSAKADIPMDIADAAKFKAQVELLAHELSESVKVRIPVEMDEEHIDQLVKRTDAKFSLLKFAGLSAGLPAAALAGAVATGAILASVPLLFGGIAAAALTNNAKVSSSWHDTADKVKSDTYAMALPLEGTLVKASEKVSASFVRMQPQIQTAMEESSDGVLVLTDSVLSLAENALPGMVDATRNSEDALDGFESMMSDVGAGAGDMFTAMTEGQAGAGEGMKVTGSLLRDLEGFAGKLFANLANGSAGPLRDFQGTLGGVEDTVLSLTSNGMPALTGTTSGFLNVISGGVGVLKLGADALGSWAQPLASATGSLLATNTVAKLFGTSIGETGFGLRAFSTTIDESGKKTSPFRQALADTESGGSKLNRGLGAIVSNGLNPMGLALIAGGFLLDKIGESQQRAAEATARHRENVRNLTDALRQDNGVLGEHSNAVNVEALNSKNASANLAVFGGNLGTAKAAIQGNTGALATLNNKSDDYIANMARQAGLSVNAIAGLQDINHGLLENGGSYDSVKDKVAQYAVEHTTTSKSIGAGQTAVTESTNKLSGAQMTALTAIFNATGAVGDQIRAQRDAEQVYVATQAALSGMTEAQVRASQATNEHTQALYAQQNASLGLRGAELNTKSAMEEYDKVKNDGSKTDSDRAAALLKVEQAFATQEQAAYQNAFALNANKGEVMQATLANNAANAMAVQLANTFKGALPESVTTMISKFTAAQATAAGLTLGINATGEAVYRLPNGKEIKINADTNPADVAIANLRGRLNAIDGKIITSYIDVVTRYKSVGTAGVRTGANAPDFYVNGPHAAVGGLLSKAPMKRFAGGGTTGPVDVTKGGKLFGPGTGTSDSILMMTSAGPAAGSDGEFVNTAKSTKMNLKALEYANAGGRIIPVPRYADGGMIQAEDGTWVPPSFYDKAPSGPHAMYTESGFAKLRAQATGYGIGSLSAKDQDQLRTYGGWTGMEARNGPWAPAPRSQTGYDNGPAGSFVIDSSGSRLDDMLLELLRNAIRNQGGNVQLVLGSR